MATKKRRRRRTVLWVVLGLLSLCLAAVLVFGFRLRSRLQSLQQGASFQFGYEITSTKADPSALYQILEQLGATRGRVHGMYAPGQLGVALYLQDDASGAPLTRLYIDQNETLFDAGQVYRTARGSLVARAPLADVLLPKWNLGDYISQTQLATLLGVPIAEVEMQEFSQFSLLPAALKRVEPAQAKKGYTYFQLQTDQPNAPTLTLGLPLGELFAESTPLHVLILHPAHNAALELDGSLSAATPILTPPTSRMKDDDIAVFAQIRQTLQDVIAMFFPKN